MALDKVNRDWKAAVDKGPNGKVVAISGARVSLIDDTFWDLRKKNVSVACPVGKSVDAKKDRKAYLYGPKSNRKAYVCIMMTPRCAGAGEMTWEQWTRWHPDLVNPELLRARGIQPRRRHVTPR